MTGEYPVIGFTMVDFTNYQTKGVPDVRDNRLE